MVAPSIALCQYLAPEPCQSRARAVPEPCQSRARAVNVGLSISPEGRIWTEFGIPAIGAAQAEYRSTMAICNEIMVLSSIDKRGKMGAAKRRKQLDPNWQKNRHPRYKVSKVRMITREIDMERDADEVPSCGADDMRIIKQRYEQEGRGAALSVEGHSELAYIPAEKLLKDILIQNEWEREVLAAKITGIIDSYNPETEFITIVASKKVDEYMVLTTQFE